MVDRFKRQACGLGIKEVDDGKEGSIDDGEDLYIVSDGPTDRRIIDSRYRTDNLCLRHRWAQPVPPIHVSKVDHRKCGPTYRIIREPITSGRHRSTLLPET